MFLQTEKQFLHMYQHVLCTIAPIMGPKGKYPGHKTAL